MSAGAAVFLLAVLCAALLGIILYQRIVYRTGMQKALRKMSEKLEKILDEDSDEQVMVFTGEKALMDLAAQISRMLDERRRIRAEHRRSQIASKKMLSNISHDIKTPMTVILGYLEIMRLGGPGDGEMLRKVEEKAQGVMGLIDQFFTLAKLEAGDLDMEIVKVDACEIFRESVLDLYEILTQKGFAVEVDIPEKPVYIWGDPKPLRRILSNLISNAIRYGADGGYIGLSLRTEDRSVYIHVADRGKGIDRAFAQNVFERLFTMEDSRNRAIQGNGLGLTIAQDLAHKLGGEITLESEPGVRTVFTVKLRRFSSF